MISTTLATISDAHRWLMTNIIWNHRDILTEDGEQTWEGDPVAVTINQPLMNMIHPLSSFQEQKCSKYTEQLIEGVRTDLAEDKRFSYTYHERLYLESQYDEVIARLKSNKNTRRAVLYTWIPHVDNKSSGVPCLQFIHLVVRNGRLNSVVCMRSNDLLSASGPNMYAIAMLQNNIADEIEADLGTYTHIVTIPHIYPVRDAEDLKGWM